MTNTIGIYFYELKKLGFIAFPIPEFCMYTTDIFLVAAWYPIAVAIALPSLGHIKCFIF